ncbi:signal peptidase [Soonwooa sp.]|uniref:signal peptidase n=1 Tax=Soonwooa sp. TaxID=1938592 RepID=UPI0026242191|nr:signal peptidase [Soonwooa sp.]
MIKKVIFRLIAVLAFGFNQFLLAQNEPPAPAALDGGGGVGPGGRPKNPIDMYEFILVIAAVMLIVYFYQRKKKLKLS